MKPPPGLATLIDYGIVQQVVRPLMSGKEAQVYVVVAGGEECVAKVYKEANQRTFKHRSDYTEGRRTRNTRDQRAMNKRTQHGRKRDEDAWRSTEVEMIYRLRDAGVRVPEPIHFVEGVLVMEFVKDAEGHAAPRLGDLTFSASEALAIYNQLIRDVVRMLCAGVVHGDLSDFNVLMSQNGPVVIDFPQSIDPTHNPNGQKLLLRDVENLHRFLARFASDEPIRPYGEEIWSLFRKNRLEPDSKLSGSYQAPRGKTNTAEVMALIEDASRDEEFRRRGRESQHEDELEEFAGVTTPFRKVVDFTKETRPGGSAKKRKGEDRGTRTSGPRRVASSRREIPPAGPAADSTAENGSSSSGRRRRRGGPRSSESSRDESARPPKDEASSANAGKPTGTRSRRRNRRGRPRGPAEGQAGPRVVDAGAGSDARAAGRTDAKIVPKRRAKRPEGEVASLIAARQPSEGRGADRPTRRRRRRPRKVTTPE